MSAPHLFASRRTALGGALAGLATLTGCDDGGPSDRPAPTATTAPPRDADTDLVDEVISHLVAALGVVIAARSGSRELRSRLRPFERLHLAHLRALDAGDVTVSTDQPAGAGPGIDRVRAAEGRLQRQLTEAAVGAESGALAGLLASMAAAVAQHLAVLP